MKTIRFASNLVPLILDGSKTSTWRLFDDKNLLTGDVIELQEFGTDKPFARATVTHVVVKKFAELTPQDKLGHEGYVDDADMYKTYSAYYETGVGPSTELKIIRFRLRD